MSFAEIILLVRTPKYSERPENEKWQGFDLIKSFKAGAGSGLSISVDRSELSDDSGRLDFSIKIVSGVPVGGDSDYMEMYRGGTVCPGSRFCFEIKE